MSNLLYLAMAALLSALGGLAVWLRHRTPRSMRAHMDRFARELEALAPDHSKRRRPSRTRWR